MGKDSSTDLLHSYLPRFWIMKPQNGFEILVFHLIKHPFCDQTWLAQLHRVCKVTPNILQTIIVIMLMLY